MSSPDPVPRWLTLLARCCLRAYPVAFRREHAKEYYEVVAHRWLEERSRARRLLAGVRTASLILADTLRAAPRAHRGARRRSWPTGERPKRTAASRMSDLLSDAHLTIRSLARRPGFTSLVVVTLALGIGANAALFGALNRVVLRPLPYPDGDRMVYIALRHQELGWQIAPSNEVVARWRASARTVEWLETYVPETAVRTGEGLAQVLEVTTVSAGLPSALGVRPVVGRIPRASDLDPSDPPLVLLAESFWRREFGGDPGAIGRTLTLDDSIVMVAGVWPAAARLELRRVPDLWRVRPSDVLADEDAFGLVLALVREGVTVADVEAELAALADRRDDARSAFVPVVNAPYWRLGESYVQGLWLLFAGAALLLLVALANTASLLLNRTLSRAGELGVRAAVGGSTSALLRLFLMESLMLTVVGVGAALLVSRAGEVALTALAPERLSVLQGASADVRVLVYAALLAAGTALVCVLVPATQLRSLDVRRLLSRGEGSRSGGGRSRWSREALVALQVGFAVVLITGSALTLRSFRQLVSVDVGMDVDRLVQFAVRLPEHRYPSAEARSAFWGRALQAVASLPGVEGAATSGNPLMRYTLYAWAPHVEGQPPPVERGAFSYGSHVQPGFFSVAGISLLQGRGFEADDSGERVIVVNRAFAEAHGGNMVGRRLTFDDSTFYRVVGVAGDVLAGALRENPDRLQFYTPDLELDGAFERFIVRTTGDPAALIGALRARLAELDSHLPVLQARTGREVLREDTARHRFVAQLLGVFGGLALLLAATGVYGAVALEASRRTKEVGIRLALGAGAHRVLAVVLAGGFRPVLIGIAIGVVVSAWATRYLEALLYRVSATDPLSMAAGICVLVGAAAAACWIPARRTSRIDPVRVLGSE